MKKNLFKKSISLFLTVLMIMSCWVWVAPTKANAASAVSYSVTLNFNLSNCAKGGNIIIHYYPVNADGTLDKNNSGTYTFMNSLVQYSSGNDQTYTAGGSGDNRPAGDTGKTTGDIPGWPYKIVITTSGSVTTKANIAIKSIKVGNKTVLSTSTQWSCSGTSRTFEAGGTYDSIATSWPEPSWTITGQGGTSVQVPSYGSRTSATVSATIQDNNYGISWPTVSYSITGTNVTLNQSNNSASVTVTNKALSNFTNSSGTANLTLTASGAGKTSTSTVTLTAPKKEVLYENLFSLSDWYYSESSRYNDGWITTNLNAGTVKVYKDTSVGEYTTASSYPSNHGEGMYSIPVTAGKDYTVEFTASSSTNGTKITEVFLFWYDVNGNPVQNTANSATFNNQRFTGDGVHRATFTVPDTATQAEIRFDNDSNDYSTATFSNIAVYEDAGADKVDLKNWPTRPVRKVYTYNAALGSTLDVPSRIGYAFNGWYLDNDGDGVKDSGEEVTDANGNVVSSLTSFAITSNYTLRSDWTAIPYDIGYDNLFSLADWSNSGSKTPNNSANGTIAWDVNAGTITVESTANGEVYSKYSGTGDYYRMAVEPETEYVYETTVNIASGTTGQMFVFFYDANGNALTGANDGATTSPHIGNYPGSGTHQMTFKTPANCTQIGIRVGATSVGTKATYSNIGVYEKAVYDAYANNYVKVREPFYYGDTTELNFKPTREGYEFAGWVDGEGNAITSVAGLSASDTVYATWTKLIKVEFVNYDGTVLKTEYVAPGGNATPPESTPYRAPDANYEYEYIGWNASYTNVTADATVMAVYREVEHTRLHVVLDTPATCFSAGYVFKTCDCGYNWGLVLDDTGTYPQLEHDFNVQPDKGSSTGVDGVHTLTCSRACGTTKTEAHNFKVDPNHEASTATCVTPGETYYICACNQEKTIVGTTNPDNHTYDYTTGTGNGDGKTHKVYCTGDATHATVTADCTDTDKNCLCDICGQELIHVYDKQTRDNLVSEAKCEIDAVYYLTCQCGKVGADTWTDVGSALAHIWTDTEKYPATAANCTDDATYYKECSLCGISSETKGGATWTKAGTKWNHNFNGDYVSNNDGTHVQKCTNADCDATGNKQNCTYGAWTTNDATTHSHTCEHCSYTPAAQNHEWTAWTSTDKDATTAGKQTRECKVCGRTEEITCTYTSVETPANCTDDAYTTYTCSDCGHGYTVVDKDTATGHKFTGEYNYDANTDKHQQLCANNCGAYGVGTTAGEWADCVWTYANKEAGKHTATCVCGNSEEQNCSGGNATCTAPAVCEFCNEDYGTTVAHSYTCDKEYLHKATEATCTANETYYYYCEGCKQTVAGVGTYEKPDSMIPHTFTGDTWYDGAELATEAQCGVNETYYVYCSVCKASSKGTDSEATFAKEGTALTHNFGGTAVCNNDGTHTLTCQNSNSVWACDETADYNCAETAERLAVNAPTCTEAGYNEYKCLLCDYEWEVETDAALGHEYTEKIYNADHLKSDATCTTPKIYWYDCAWCDANAKDETDTDKYTVLTYESGNVRAHKWIEEVADEYLASPATCFAAAKYYKSCEYADCGVIHTDNETFSYGAALKHDWKEVKDAEYLATPADCVTDATYYYECSACKKSSKDYGDGATWTDEGSKSGHELTYHAAVAVECEKDGNIEYWSCSKCNKNFSDAEGTAVITGKVEITAPGHDWVKYSYKAATCEEDGHNAYEECSRCQTKKAGYTVYSATGHNFTGAWTYDAVYNYHSKLCLNYCGESGMVINGEQVEYTVEYVGIDFVITGGEACDFSGKAEHYVDTNGNNCHGIVCACGNSTGAVCFDDAPEVFDPTCTANGYTLHTCDVCSFQWKTDEVVTEGHNWSENAISNGDGTHSVKCSVCGETKGTVKCSGGTATCKDKAVCEICKTPYGETTDHTLADDGWTSNNDATCTADGTKWQNCSVCSEKVVVKDEGSKLGHKMTEYGYDISGWKNKPADFDEEIKAPTCKDEGLSISYCERCDCYATKIVKADKEAHIWATDANGELIWTTVGGDCSTGVTMKNVCTVCGKSQTKVENADHKWVEKVRVEANCDTDGYILYECSVCSFTELFDANDEGYPVFNGEDTGLTLKLGHSWEREGANDELIVDKAATCGHAGRGYYICTVCQAKSDYVEIAKLAHVWDQDGDGFTDADFDIEAYLAANPNANILYVEATEADCVNDGYAEHFRCIDCSYDQSVDAAWREKNFTKAYGHKDNDGDGKCDGKDCGKNLSNNNSGCGCICHKDNWFMQIIYKILRFFWKLFKIGKSCDCGFVHY